MHGLFDVRRHEQCHGSGAEGARIETAALGRVQDLAVRVGSC